MTWLNNSLQNLSYLAFHASEVGISMDDLMTDEIMKVRVSGDDGFVAGDPATLNLIRGDILHNSFAETPVTQQNKGLGQIIKRCAVVEAE